MKKIDLGEKIDMKSELAMPEPPSPDEPRISYPRLSIYGAKNAALGDIPKGGKAIIEYEVKRREVSKTDDKPASFTLELEIHSIEPVPKKNEKKSVEQEPAESESAMDQLLEEIA